MHENDDNHHHHSINCHIRWQFMSHFPQLVCVNDDCTLFEGTIFHLQEAQCVQLYYYMYVTYLIHERERREDSGANGPQFVDCRLKRRSILSHLYVRQERQEHNVERNESKLNHKVHKFNFHDAFSSHKEYPYTRYKVPLALSPLLSITKRFTLYFFLIHQSVREEEKHEHSVDLTQRVHWRRGSKSKWLVRGRD